VKKISLTKLEVTFPAFRKLKNFKIDFAQRITLIAGHNGIGKSTILALVANGSGITNAKQTSYMGKTFQASLNEIIHLDYVTELEQKKVADALPNPSLEYLIDGRVFTKRCGLTKRTINDKDGNFLRLEARVVPRNVPENGDGFTIGDSSKVPLPTIYLGMARMLPIGESDPELVDNQPDTAMDPSDATYIADFINRVIGFTGPPGLLHNITTQAIKGTSKVTKHPQYSHSPKSISLGQDSLSAIATALASFRKLKREWPDYPGGLLVIDELDAGFHPHAQQKLIEGIKNSAKLLDVQVVATTHSLCLIENVHPESNPIGGKGKHVDSVVYITDSIQPRVTDDFSLEDIRNDMALKAPMPEKVPKKILKCYLEDAEASFFLQALLTTKFKAQIKTETNTTLKVIPISIGCGNLQGLPKHDPYFKEVLLVVDADAHKSAGLTNTVKLPGLVNGKGASPEKTIYEFIKALVQPNDDFLATRKHLKKLKVSSDQLSEHLLQHNLNINDRDAAKRWWNSKLELIKGWKLVHQWLDEHPEQTQAFKDEFLAAAKATAKLVK